MSLTRLIAGGVVLGVVVGCAGFVPQSTQPMCTSNTECPGTEVCFPNQGCADPSTNLVVEVAGDAQSGLYPQDIAVDSLMPVQNFALPGALKVQGQFTQENTPYEDPSNRSSYTSKVTLRALGKSLLIPGLTRSYESTVTGAQVYSMNMGSGLFTMSAFPAEISVPPVGPREVQVTSATDDNVVNFVFPSVEGSVTMAGRVIKYRDTKGKEFALTSAKVTIQVFNPSTGAPLSQKADVSSGLEGSRGDFTVMVSPAVRNLKNVNVVVSPVSSGALVPSRTFSEPWPFRSQLVFEMGNFGDPVSTSGHVVDSDGNPVADAKVTLSGPVNGGGVYTSQVVSTDAEGNYRVDALPNDQVTAALSKYTVGVMPPARKKAGFATASLRVSPGAAAPKLEIACPDRVLVTGNVVLPDENSVAEGVRVVATQTAGSNSSLSLPQLVVDEVTSLSDSTGRFELRLDPGTWKLDFLTEMMLPVTENGTPVEYARMTRLLTVEAPQVLESSSTNQVAIPHYALLKGKRVSGVVTSDLPGHPGVPVANASLRFFRITQIAGKDAAILLGTTTADDRGAYSVVMPVR